MSTPPPLEEHLLRYRDTLIAADQKAQEEFDKIVVTLSGGGLGVSLVFLKDVIGPDPIIWPWMLMAAWISWAVSVLAVLGSYHLSHLAIRRGISQIDEGEAYTGSFGGKYAKYTALLNVSGAAFFFIGVLCITLFACINLSEKGNTSGNLKVPAASASAPSTPTATASSAAAGSKPASRGQ